MKTIGLLGGMSWESTVPYYRLINEGCQSPHTGWFALRELTSAQRGFS